MYPNRTSSELARERAYRPWDAVRFILPLSYHFHGSPTVVFTMWFDSEEGRRWWRGIFHQFVIEVQ